MMDFHLGSKMKNEALCRKGLRGVALIMKPSKFFYINKPLSTDTKDTLFLARTRSKLTHFQPQKHPSTYFRICQYYNRYFFSSATTSHEVTNIASNSRIVPRSQIFSLKKSVTPDKEAKQQCSIANFRRLLL